MNRQAILDRSSMPYWLISFAILIAAVKKAWRRRRIFGPALAMMAFGAWSGWQAIGYPSGWVETQGHVLATEERAKRNPLRNLVVRFETEEGWKVDFLDGHAAAYLEQGLQAARQVPIAYNPEQPKQAMILAEGRWHQPFVYLLAGMCLATLALLWPERRRV